MPPRLVTLAVIVFWLAMTSRLFYREFASRVRTDEAPPFTIDLTAEVGVHVVNWRVLQKNEPIGMGFTQVKRQEDRTYELYSQFKLDKPFQLLALKLQDLKAVSAYRVTEEGRLRKGSADLKCVVHAPFFEPVPIQFLFDGEVREGHFHPKVTVSLHGAPLPAPPLEPFPVSDTGSILNPMHLVHKIGGLQEGSSWRVPLLDPLRAVPAALAKELPVQNRTVNELRATVHAVDRLWNGESVPCFKISYALRDEPPLAATWVRRRDSVVLEQWASYEGVEYNIQRLPGQ